RIVALKTLKAGADVESGAERLLAEARAASALSHPPLAVVYGVEHAHQDGERFAYIAMEYVEGTTLAEMARERPLDLDVVLNISEQIADAMADVARLRV